MVLKLKTPFEWQKEAINKINGHNFGLIIAPPGAGKTTTQNILAIKDVLANPNQKQLFIVPQSIIGAGFAETNAYNVDGKTYFWKAGSVCDDSEGKIQQIIDYLLSDCVCLFDNNVVDIAMVCTHQAFNLAIQRLTQEQINVAKNNLTLRIDEAHHVGTGNSDSDSDEFVVNDNVLGSIVDHIMKNPGVNTKIVYSTATPSRADNKPIVAKEFQDQFVIYRRNTEDHLRHIGITDISVSYINYQKDEYAQRAVEEIKNKLDSNESKRIFVRVPNIIERGANFMNDYYVTMRNLLPNANNLDLVDKATQDENKTIWLSEPKSAEEAKTNPVKFDVVTTCAMGLEGADWCPCDTVMFLKPTKSGPLNTQIIGRTFREWEGKNRVNVVYFNEALNINETLRDKLSDHLNSVVLHTLSFMELICPIKVPKKKKQKNQSEGFGPIDTTSEEEYQPLAEAMFPNSFDPSLDYIKAIQDINKEFQIKAIRTTDRTFEEIADEIIADYLLENDIEDEDGNIAEGIKASIAVTNKKKQDFSLYPKFDIKNLRTQDGIDFLQDGGDLFFFADLSPDDLSFVREVFTTDVDKLKAEFIKEAEAGLPKPSTKIDGRRYMKFQSYMIADQSFKKTILSIRPDWKIVCRSSSTNQIKNEFIKDAKAGMDRPNERVDKQKYSRFAYYMKSDEIFRNTILSIRPDWAMQAPKDFYETLEEASKKVISKGCQNQKQFYQMRKSGEFSDRMPCHPDQTYKDAWTGWHDFLGKK